MLNNQAGAWGEERLGEEMRFFSGGSVVNRNLSQSGIRFWVLSLCLAALPGAGTPVARAQGQQSREGAFVYTVNNELSGTTDQLINGYVVNPIAGTLSAAEDTPFAAGAQVFAVVAHPSGKFVYAATTIGTVAAYTVDSYAGTLTPVLGAPFVTGGLSNDYGQALAIDPAGKYLYLVERQSVYGFSIDSDSGALTPVSGSPLATTINPSAATVDPSGQYLAVSGGSGPTQVYSINRSTGGLTAVNSPVTNCGGSAMTFEPSGRFLYGTATYGITACSFSSTSGSLTPVSGSPFDSATDFTGLAVHPSGSFLYASEPACRYTQTSNGVYGYLIDPSTGALAAIAGSPFALPGEPSCFYDYDVATEASGNFVYTVVESDGIAAYTVNQSTGALTLAVNSFYGPGALGLTTVPNSIASTVTPTSLAITPATALIADTTLGQQTQFTLQATFSDGSTGFLTGSAT